MDLSERNMSQVGEVWLVLRWHTEELQTVEELRGVQEEDKWNREGRERRRREREEVHLNQLQEMETKSNSFRLSVRTHLIMKALMGSGEIFNKLELAGEQTTSSALVRCCLQAPSCSFSLSL